MTIYKDKINIVGILTTITLAMMIYLSSLLMAGVDTTILKLAHDINNTYNTTAQPVPDVIGSSPLVGLMHSSSTVIFAIGIFVLLLLIFLHTAKSNACLEENRTWATSCYHVYLFLFASLIVFLSLIKGLNIILTPDESSYSLLILPKYSVFELYVGTFVVYSILVILWRFRGTISRFLKKYMNFIVILGVIIGFIIVHILDSCPI